ncbi:MAG: PfkB family carbohydrate kinase [Acidimicrobiales bacterium]
MITVVGEALVDLVVAADGAITVRTGGAPFNVARTCARLGAPVSLVAAISTDRFGQRLMADLTADGVHTEQVQPVDRPTTLAVAELDSVGAATYRFYLEGTSAVALAPAQLPAITRAVVAGGLGLAVEPMAAAVERIVLDAGDDVLVMVDLNCRPDAVGDPGRYLARLGRVLVRADVIKASIEDLCYIDGTTPPAVVAAARLMSGRTRTVLLTAGAAATTVVTATDKRAVAVTNSPVVDTIGAGDSFTAGFLSWWMVSGHTVDDLANVDVIVPAVHAAHQVAAVVVGRRGADPPHRRELSPDWAPG